MDKSNKAIGPIYMNNFRNKSTHHLTDELPFDDLWSNCEKNDEQHKVRVTENYLIEQKCKEPYNFMEWTRANRKTKEKVHYKIKKQTQAEEKSKVIFKTLL
jgi:hypothetical protein